MYIPGKHRYDNYTSRYDVYLFTLRDYCEMLLFKFDGQYINRSDMPIHSGYLLELINYDDAVEFITAIAESKEEKDGVVTYVLPHLDGNELPLYATTKKGINYLYIGLSEYAEALDNVEAMPVTEVTADACAQSREMFGYTVSDLQNDDVAVSGDKITGTLKYIDSGDLASAWGAGNFVALKFVTNDWDQYTSVKVGLDPSEGDGLVEVLSDPDKDGAFKVTNKDTQVFKIVATNGGSTVVKTYDLSGLTLLSE